MLKFISILLIISTCAAGKDVSSLLSHLLKKGGSGSTPLILVLDKNSLSSLGNLQSNEKKDYDSSQEERDSLQSLVQQLSQLQKGESSNLEASRHRHRPRSSDRYQTSYRDSSQGRYQHGSHDSHYDRHHDKYHSRSQDINQHSHERHNHHPSKKTQEQSLNMILSKTDSKSKTVLRSDPIIKGLLTLRNSLRCGAQTECKNECEDNFKGKKKNSCDNSCEEKFECQEPEDECADSGGDRCDEGGSTKGVTLVTEKPGCTRC